MTRRRFPRLLVALWLVAAVACGPSIDLATALEVTDVFSGWYDDGIKDAKTHLVPSVTFRLKNKGADAFSGVQLNVDFWIEGADGEWGEVVTRGIGSDALAAGASTEPITVRPLVGYNLEGARADFFANSLFKDAIAKIFANRGGKIVKIGEFKVDRRIIPHVDAGRP